MIHYMAETNLKCQSILGFTSMRTNELKTVRMILIAQAVWLIVQLCVIEPGLAFGRRSHRQEHDSQLGEVNPNPVDEEISVSGVVVNELGQPIPDATVYLREWAVRRDTAPPAKSTSIFRKKRKYTFAQTKSDESGTFHFKRIQPPPINPTKGVEHAKSRWTVVAEVPGRALGWLKLVEPKTVDPIRLVLPKSTSIEGVVLDLQGTPISGVEVYVDEISKPKTKRYQRLDSPDQFVYRNSELTPRSTTDEEGKFKLTQIPPDRRIGIAFVHANFRPQIAYMATTEKPLPSFEETIIRSRRRVSNTYPVQHGKMQVALDVGHQLYIQIVDQDGNKVANQPFELLFGISFNRLYRQANESGTFESERFSESKGWIRVRNPIDKRYVDSVFEFQFSPKETRKEIVCQLPRTKIIRGKLQSKDLKPIDGATVVFAPNAEADALEFAIDRNEVVTNELGEYELRVSADAGVVAPIGPVFGYELPSIFDLEKYQKRELPPPETWKSVDFSEVEIPADPNKAPQLKVDFLVPAGLVLKGSVFGENGKPAANATVKVVDGLFDKYLPFARMSREKIQEFFQAETDENGEFRIPGIPRDATPVFSVVDSTEAKNALIYVAELDDLENVKVTLSEGVVVTGKVTLDGEPQKDVTVFLNVIGNYKLGENGKSEMEQFHWGRIKTDASGSYRFSGLPPKPSYFVSARLNQDAEDSRNPKLEESNFHIEVPTFAFKTPNSTIAGVVIDPEGNPIEGVEISASRMGNGRRLTGFRNPRVQTKPDGSFLFERMPDDTAVTLRASKPRIVDGVSRFRLPARVDVMSGDRNVRIVMDLRLGKRPRKLEKTESGKTP